ncbi:MAG TPA: pepsin/retropepsin-like aspartic protease family protein [Pyrinomonadaceae bacterium]|nr:pepsin/retropepsin-like aspartic protease family protein [Pyrinomonadaceae bacterium]
MKRFILSSVLIIAFAAVSFADVRFTSGKSVSNIPFKLLNNHIYLQVSVNNSKPLWFLLDTGAGNVINLRHAQALGLKLTSAGQTTGVGEGMADVFITDNVSYSLPGVTVTQQKFAVLSLANVEECLTKVDIDVEGQIRPRTPVATDKEERPMDGILGDQFLRLFVVEIDFIKKTINLHDPESYRYKGDGEKIPLEIEPSRIYMRAPITGITGSAINGRFYIDTGSATAITLASPFVDQNKLLPPPDQTTPFPICGIGGDSQTQIGRVNEISLGKIKVEKSITMFSRAKNGVLASSDFSGHIGNALLRNFRVVFDYSRRVMILERVKELPVTN